MALPPKSRHGQVAQSACVAWLPAYGTSREILIACARDHTAMAAIVRVTHILNCYHSLVRQLAIVESPSSLVLVEQQRPMTESHS